VVKVDQKVLPLFLGKSHEVEDGIWIVTFLDYDLGYFDEESRKVEPIDDPFGLTFGLKSVNDVSGIKCK